MGLNPKQIACLQSPYLQPRKLTRGPWLECQTQVTHSSELQVLQGCVCVCVLPSSFIMMRHCVVLPASPPQSTVCRTTRNVLKIQSEDHKFRSAATNAAVHHVTFRSTQLRGYSRLSAKTCGPGEWQVRSLTPEPQPQDPDLLHQDPPLAVMKKKRETGPNRASSSQTPSRAC